MSARQRPSRLALLTLTLSLAAAPRGARAVDGVIEINQARALAGGVTAGDAPGFPVTVDSSGSYRLTGNLTLTGADSIGIEVTATRVAIDLNGFGILGPVRCAGASPTLACAPAGNGAGVAVTGADTTLWVKNGDLRGTGSHGILAADAELIADSVHVAESGGDGIEAGASSVITRSTVERSGGDGIVAGKYSLVRDCVARGNQANGIVHAGLGVVASNTASENGLIGIIAPASTIAGNTSSLNHDWGILSGAGATILDNTVTLNASFALGAGASGYARNVFTGNNGGGNSQQVIGGAFETGANICGTDTACP